MKRQLLSFLLVVAAGASSYAQCDKRTLVTSSKTEFLNAAGEVQRSVDENTTIEYDKKEIVITPGNDQTMTGAVKSDSCVWKTPYKEGITVLKAVLTDPQGQTMNLTVTIEGKEGKITFIAEIDTMADQKIRITVEKFEEKK